MALSKRYDKMGAEIEMIDLAKGVLQLQLDSGERAWTHRGLLLKPLESYTEGQEITVMLLDQDQNKTFQTRWKVSERMDVKSEDPDAEVDESASADAPPDPALVKAYPVGKGVKGTVHSVRADDIYVTQPNGLLARLPVSELNGTKKDSLRVGVCVKANVLRVDGTGVVLTRKPKAA